MALDKDIDAILHGNTPAALQLNKDELLLIDWVLCVYSHTIQADIEEVVEAWHLLRKKVWESIEGFHSVLTTSPVPTVSFDVDDVEAKWLLGMLPTTFRWGTGPDCGYSLKRKLACFLLGREYRAAAHPETIVTQD
jgi:hypothetical protein